MRDLMLVLKAVADKNRMRILKMLERKSMCVCELAAVLGIKQPSVSKHLVILKNAGLIEDERNGQGADCPQRTAAALDLCFPHQVGANLHGHATAQQRDARPACGFRVRLRGVLDVGTALD